jgi:hypothetical protein
MTGPVREVKKAEKLSVANVTKRHRTKLEVKGVVLGAHVIQQGMNRLVPEVTCPRKFDSVSFKTAPLLFL